MEIKNYIGETMKGKRLRFKCSCLFPFDFIGTIKDYTVINNELVFNVDNGTKIIKIGENHPNLEILEV